MYTIVDGSKKYIGDRDDLASLKEGIDGSIVVVDQGDGICWLELPPSGRRKKTRWLSPSRPMSGAHLSLTHVSDEEDRAWRLLSVEGGEAGWLQIQWVRDPTLYIQTHSSFLRLGSTGSIWQTDNRLYTMMYGTRRFLTSEDKRPVVRPTAAATYIVNRGHGLVSIETRRPGYGLRFWHTNLLFSGKTVEPEWRLIPQTVGGFLIQSTRDTDLFLTVLPDGDVLRSTMEYAKIWFVGSGTGAGDEA